MSPDAKIACELLSLTPAKLRDVTKWLGMQGRDYQAGETELQHICMILLRAEQTDRLYKLGDWIDFLLGRGPRKRLTTNERRAAKRNALKSA